MGSESPRPLWHCCARTFYRIRSNCCTWRAPRTGQQSQWTAASPGAPREPLNSARLLAFRRPAPPGSIALLRSQDPLPVLAPAEQALILLPFQSTPPAIPSCVPAGSVRRRWLLAPGPNEVSLLPSPVGPCSWPTSYLRPPGCVAPQSVRPFAHRPAAHADD